MRREVFGEDHNQHSIGMISRKQSGGGGWAARRWVGQLIDSIPFLNWGGAKVTDIVISLLGKVAG